MFSKNPFSEYRATQQTVQESKFLIPEEIPATERTAFHGAAAAAHKAGKTHFTFAGKKHPVTMKKDTANAIADQKEGYYKDLEIKKQDKEMGAKPVPAKKKKEAKGGGKEGDVEMNPKMDTGGKSEQKESRIRSALKSVLESNRDDHYKSATKPETMKDMRKGKGAEDMMADADKEIDKGPDAHLNEPAIDKENFKKMTSNVPSKKMRKNDNPKGDTKIVPGGTQFKDPAAMKAEESVTKADDKQSGGFVHKESVSFAQSINNMRNAYASMYATKEENSEDLDDVQEAKEGDWGTGTADNYTHHVKGYTGERGDPEHHAMLAAAKKRNVKVTAGKSKEYMFGGRHIILRGKKKDVDHVIDNHIGRDE